MPRVCTVCTHKKRSAIDAALVAGEPYRSIAKRAKPPLSPSAMLRHKENHLPAHLAQARAAQEVVRADDLLSQVRDLQVRTLKILGKAEKSGALGTAVSAIREARGNIELQARLIGQLQEKGATVNVLVVNPEWIDLRTRMLIALKGFPDAKRAIAGVMSNVELGNVVDE